ncbi:uncharacterized protein SPSK_05673 [Sporothrix schenckii 1099-18]|uniref:Uncharacterized protein n=1 Tax=Sporothrix schenckii 1099-18 TaxID=1397361 RepID=A0A0F2LSL0_SPOSC|nr:uncharacterized protein SPSK_05673 [Sporothrix schenckii 1099-18]KJR80457.1 hypothetical protein SPSK_05673 [Sporothrix schenckii 1099-18]
MKCDEQEGPEGRKVGTVWDTDQCTYLLLEEMNELVWKLSVVQKRQDRLMKDGMEEGKSDDENAPCGLIVMGFCQRRESTMATSPLVRKCNKPLFLRLPVSSAMHGCHSRLPTVTTVATPSRNDFANFIWEYTK